MNKSKRLFCFIILSLWSVISFANNLSTTMPIDNIPGDSYYPSDDNESARQDGSIRSWYSVVWAGLYGDNPPLNWKKRGKLTGAHPGMDVRVKVGTIIHSIADGIVVYARNTGSAWGNVVIIEHTNQFDNSHYWSVYAHLGGYDSGGVYKEPFLVDEGIEVVKGQSIANSGNSGPTVQHLHFQIQKEYVNDRKPYWPPGSYNIGNESSVTPAIIQDVRNNTFDPISFCLGVGHFIDGWHNTINTSDGVLSQWFADAYIRSSPILKKPMNNGGTEFVHKLPREVGLPAIYGQDFDGGMIIANSALEKAFVLQGAFAYIYRGGIYTNQNGSSNWSIWGPNDLGTPLSNEVFEYFTNEYGRQVVIRQYFEKGRLTYLTNLQSSAQGVINIEFGVFSPDITNTPNEDLIPVPVDDADNLNYISGGDLPADLTGMGGGGGTESPTSTYNPPTNLSAVAVGSNKIQTSWDAIPGIYSYIVSLTKVGSTDPNDHYSFYVNDNSFLFSYYNSNLQANSQYELEVRAKYGPQVTEESETVGGVFVTTLSPASVAGNPMSIILCDEQVNYTCTNEKSSFPYTPKNVYMNVRLANLYYDTLYIRPELYYPSGVKFPGNFALHGRFDGETSNPWYTFMDFTQSVKQTANREGEWNVKLYCGNTYTTVNQFCGEVNFIIEDAGPPPGTVSGVTAEVVW